MPEEEFPAFVERRIKEIFMPAGILYTPSEKLLARIANDFTYHAPHGDQDERYVAIRNACKGLALLMASACPESRELSLALTAIEQASFYANAAIARNEEAK